MHTYVIKVLFFLTIKVIRAELVLAEEASRRSVTAEARVQSQTTPCGICDGNSAVWAVFCRITADLPCQYYSTDLHTHLLVCHWHYVTLEIQNSFQ